MIITVHETKPSIWVQSITDLDQVIASASNEAHAEGLLGIVFLEADNGNCVSLVVGGNERELVVPTARKCKARKKSNG